MDCSIVERNELAERYLLGKLSPGEQESYELHFFDCERCLAEVRSLQAIQDALRANPPLVPEPQRDSVWIPWWKPLATGAVAASLVGVVLLLRPAGAPEKVAQTEDGASSVQPPAAVPQADVMAEPSTSPPEPAERPVTEARRVAALAHLARVEPPRYSAIVLRGATDEATLRFQAGMKLYSAEDYQGAVLILREAATLEPSRADIAFFLGASELMSGDTKNAAKELRRTIAMGNTPFLEEAHFYLAKAHLKQGDEISARAEFVKVQALHGEKAEEAGEMLAQIAALPSG